MRRLIEEDEQVRPCDCESVLWVYEVEVVYDSQVSTEIPFEAFGERGNINRRFKEKKRRGQARFPA